MSPSRTALAGTDVIVAGGGTGGMAAALLLAASGATVTQLEQAAALSGAGARTRGRRRSADTPSIAERFVPRSSYNFLRT